jgi:hypothetical protein
MKHATFQSTSRRELMKVLAPAAAILAVEDSALGSPAGQVRIFAGEASDIEALFNELLSDPQLKQFLDEQLPPLLTGLAFGLGTTPIPDSEMVPVAELSAQLRAELSSQLKGQAPELISELLSNGSLGPPPDSATLDAIINDSLNLVATVLANPTLDPSTAVRNQASDFEAAVIDDTLAAQDRLGRGLIVLSPAQKIAENGPQDDAFHIGEFMLYLSLTVEIIGLIAGTLGLALPKVNLAKIFGKVAPTLTSPSVRDAFAAFLRALRAVNATLESKAGAVVDLLIGIAASGTLTRIIAAIVSEFSFGDALRIGISLLAYFGATFFSGGAVIAANLARIGLTLGAAINELIQKIQKLVKS